MDGLSIIGVALGVGVVVYALSLRSADEALGGDGLPPAPTATRSPLAWFRERTARPTGEELGFGPEPAAVEGEPQPESFVYVPVLASDGPHWQTRIGGAIGLLAVVIIAAIVVAFGFYQLGHALNQLVQGFLGN
ncbi:MAG: hypothetical protein ACXVP7_11975 [Actinomycetota bacterium]